MNCTRVHQLLRGYLEGELGPQERLTMEFHLESCSTCSQELEVVWVLLPEASWLPRESGPAGTLTQRAHQAPSVFVVDAHDPSATLHHRKPTRQIVTARSPSSRPRLARWRVRPFVNAAIAAIAVSGMWFSLNAPDVNWEVGHVAGLPSVHGEPFTGRAEFHVGDWLETDEWSRARIEVGMIGQVDVGPGTRLRLIEATDTDHRIFLEKGTIVATIWARPRLFFVQTPTVLATDLGCEYSLRVDESGEGFIEVRSGIVALAGEGKESTIHAGAACRTIPEIGPGTPFALSSSDLLQEALARFDCEPRASDALDIVLREARPEDAISLWHLLTRVDEEACGRVFDRLAMLAPPPRKVAKDGVIAGDTDMLTRWAENLGVSHPGSDLR